MNHILILTFLCLFITVAVSKFQYGQHFPNGHSAVDYIYSDAGTFRPMSTLEYIWNYYEQYQTPTHPYNKSALINAADGSKFFTARDANGYLLCDQNRDLEINGEETKCGSAFHEHSGKGVGGLERGRPFTQFWLDDNWLASTMSRIYNRAVPDGLVDQPGQFMRWKMITGQDPDSWTLYNSTHFDTLALDGLYFLTLDDVVFALELWDKSLNLSQAKYNHVSLQYDYPAVHENYHVGMWKILTDQILAQSQALDSETTSELLQHSISLRALIMANQERDKDSGKWLGWISEIGSTSALINTEGVSVNSLALGAGTSLTFEASLAPMKIGSQNYIARPQFVLSAMAGSSGAGLMLFGPNIQLVAGNYTVQFILRTPKIQNGIARLDVYDSTTSQSIATHELHQTDFQVANDWALVPLKFYVDQKSGPDHEFEFRVYWHGVSNLDIATIRVIHEYEMEYEITTLSASAGGHNFTSLSLAIIVLIFWFTREKP